MELAHGVGGRSDLPVPLWLALYGGAGAVLVSFFAVAALWTGERTRADGGRPLPDAVQRFADHRATRYAVRGAGLAAAAALLVVAFAGPQDSLRNPAPTWFYVWFWVSLAPLSVIVGPVWRWLNPLRAITAGLRTVAGRRFTARPLPPGIGYWPGAAGLLAFLWLELVYDHPDTPRTVGVFLLGYGIAQVGLGFWYGQRWFDRGDGFEAYSTLFGHLSPVGRREDGRLVLRSPLAGLAGLRSAPGLVATVAVILGSTGFDGLSRTSAWRDATQGLDRAPTLLLGTAGLVACAGVVLLTYHVASGLSQRYAPRLATAMQVQFVPSLLPIALGYTVAHYFSLAVFQGQAGYLLASDPFGRGWDLLGVAGRGVDYTVVAPQAIAFVQVGAIVLGHVAGVVAAHDRAVVTFPRRYQRSGQYPLLAAMVAYTMGGIALVVGV